MVIGLQLETFLRLLTVPPRIIAIVMADLLFSQSYYFVVVLDQFLDRYIVSELMQSDLHKIIISSQPLTSDHIKLFTYQILRGE